jgi:hypothetical protein
MMRALEHFTLFLKMTWLAGPDAVLKMLAPLKDLGLKNKWELRLHRGESHIDDHRSWFEGSRIPLLCLWLVMSFAAVFKIFPQNLKFVTVISAYRTCLTKLAP